MQSLKAPKMFRSIPFLSTLTVPYNIPYILIPVVYISITMFYEDYKEYDTWIYGNLYLSAILQYILISLLVLYYFYDTNSIYYKNLEILVSMK